MFQQALVVANANTTCVVLNLQSLLYPKFLNSSTSQVSKYKIVTSLHYLYLIENNQTELTCELEKRVSFDDLNNNQEILWNEAIPQIERNQYGKKYKETGYQLIKIGIAFKGSKFGFTYKLQ